MKKIATFISTVLALSMMSLTVSAESPITASGGNDTADVKGTYHKEDVVTVYSVDIEWGDMEFTFTDDFKGTWNPTTHKYDDPVPAGWAATNANGNKITITNHSNVGIDAGLTYAAAVDYSDVAVGFTDTDSVTAAAVTKLSLDTADNGTEGAAGTATTSDAYVQITSGRLSSDDTSVKLGTVTITITDKV